MQAGAEGPQVRGKLRLDPQVRGQAAGEMATRRGLGAPYSGCRPVRAVAERAPSERSSFQDNVPHDSARELPVIDSIGRHTSVNREHSSHARGNHYWRLFIMGLLSFIAMYGLMYVMVDVIGNVYLNVNQFYMAGLMTAPMVVIEVWLMNAMYANKRVNALITGGAVLGGLSFLILIRQQAGITDRQFLRSMIPHHASAILMCERAAIEEPDIKELCSNILSSQQEQIDLMRAKLLQLGG